MEINERIKAEAMDRMKELKKVFDLNPKLVKYLEEGKLYYSYLVSGLFGCIDTINYDKDYAEIVNVFQKETGNYVYHAIETKSAFGRLLSLLYVSVDEERWPMQRLESDYITAYVYNIDDEFGEYGDIFLTSDNGALLRKA